MRGRTKAWAACVGAVLAAASTLSVPVAAQAAGDGQQPTVIGRRVIGHSAQGRPIIAYHLGDPGAPGAQRVVLIATMHGNEPAPRQILTTLRDGRPLLGIDLWVVPTYNPDGLAAGTRKNAHGVDLNRNYPYGWKDLDGNYESGPRPASEPETRAMMGFLRSVRPHRILSFHQPLDAVDIDTKRPAFARRVARALHLPTTDLDCGGVCHGTMTAWYNRHFAGNALTVEYGQHPGRRRMTVDAPRQVLRLFGATHGEKDWKPAS